MPRAIFLNGWICFFSAALAVCGAQPAINAVVNGASFQSGPIAPGELLVISGSGLGPAEQTSAPAGPLPTALGGTRVLFDGVAAPLLYTSATQLSVISPMRLVPGQTTQISVEYQGAVSAAKILPVEPTAPGLFTVAGYRVAAINPNDTVNGPSNPAPPASVVALYGTGLGKAFPVYEDGALVSADRLPVPLATFSIALGGLPAASTYVGGAPGLPAGIEQINFEISSSSASGHVPVWITAGERSSALGEVIVAPSAPVEIAAFVTGAGVARSGTSGVATVSLRTPAPPEGVWVALTTDHAALSLPMGVFIPGGDTSASVAFQAPAVSSLSQYSLSATLFTNLASTVLRVLPQAQGVAILAVTAQAVSLGIDVTVTLTGPAPGGGVAISLSPPGPGLIAPSHIVVPSGETTATVRLLYSSSQVTDADSLRLTVEGQTVTASLPAALPGWQADALQDGSPDIASIGMSSRPDGVVLHARFAAGTFDPQTAVTAFSVDTDRLQSSGFAGTYPMGLSPLEMGTDIVVIYGGACFPSLASIYTYDNSSHLLRLAGELPVSVSPAPEAGFDIAVPDSFFQNSKIRLRAVTWKEPSTCGFAGLNDVAPAGSAPPMEALRTSQ